MKQATREFPDGAGSVLYRPLIDSARELSWASPTVPIDGHMRSQDLSHFPGDEICGVPVTIFVLVADSILLPILIHKLVTVIKCVAWIHVNGREFEEKLIGLRTDLRQHSPGHRATYGDICYVLWNVGGDHGPGDPRTRHFLLRLLRAYDNGMKFAAMGFKEYRPLAFAELLMASEDRRAQRRGRVIRILAKSYDFVVLGFVAGIFVVLSGLVTTRCHIHAAIWTLGLTLLGAWRRPNAAAVNCHHRLPPTQVAQEFAWASSGQIEKIRS